MIPTIQEAERALGEPAVKWAGRCYEISCNLVRVGLVEGDPVYGNYRGPVVEGSMFSGKPFIRHGWIRTLDGIVDPTRWVFEGVEPYIYQTGLDDPTYDEGAQVLRRLTHPPPPEFDESDKEVKPDGMLQPYEWALLNDLVGGTGRLTIQQLAWIANLPMGDDFPEAREAFEALDKLGLKVFVPVDNWRMATGTGGRARG